MTNNTAAIPPVTLRNPGMSGDALTSANAADHNAVPAANDQRFPRQEYQEPCRQLPVPLAQVIDDQQRAGDDERDAIRRPCETSELGGRRE
jgi:hypothetical protein